MTRKPKPAAGLAANERGQGGDKPPAEAKADKRRPAELAKQQIGRKPQKPSRTAS